VRNSVHVIRGGHLESSHAIHAAVADATGRLIASVGDPQTLTFLRSAAKPFQTLALLRSGVADRFPLCAEEIAVICASHNGEDMHLDQVRAIMTRIGITEEHLQCGYHPPFHPPQNEKIVRQLLTPTPLFNNCSGKHVGKLAACLHQGYPTENYLDIDHPHQQSIHGVLSEYSGTTARDIGVATDGCGAPTFYLSLQSMATMFAKLAASDGTEENSIRSAMSNHPALVAGTGRFDTLFMQKVGNGAISKVGAQR